MTLVTVDLGYYVPIKDRVLQARAAFDDWVASLPLSIGWAVKEMSRGNREAPLPGNLLGERDAFWLGELFDASEEDQQKAALGCICGYAYVLYQDHSVEQGRRATLGHELARNYLFSKMLQSFEAVARHPDMFWRYWTRYLKEYTDACLLEVAKERLRSAYDDHDLRMVARRSALVKACMAGFALATGQEERIPQCEQGIDDLVIGLQIRDDLADADEDAAAGQHTYVISKLAEAGHQALSAPLMEELLSKSTAWLLEAADTLGLQDTSALRLYIERLTAENAAIQEVIRTDPQVSIGELQERAKLEY